MEKRYKPVVLCVIDGFGLSSSWRGNAVFSAVPKNFFEIWENYPHYLLQYQHNHLNTPAYDNPERYLASLLQGREIKSQRVYIDIQIEKDLLKENDVLDRAFRQTSEKNSSLHFIGNLSGQSGKFSEIEHLFALLKLAKERKVFRAYIHLILDNSGGGFSSILKDLSSLEQELEKLGIGEIASVSGLDFLSDSEKSFLNFSKAYKAIVEGNGNSYLSAQQTISKNKEALKSPSSVPPSVISSQNNPVGVISDFDSIIFFNHNNREIAKLILAFSSSSKNLRLAQPKFLFLATFFDCLLPKPDEVNIVFDRNHETSLPQILYKAGLNQAFVSDSTRMLSIKSQIKELGNVSDRVFEDFLPIVDLDAYLNNAKGTVSNVFSRAIDVIARKKYDFVFIDLPCIDEIADNGSFKETVAAIKAVDYFLPALLQSVLGLDGVLIITSNYGNAEKMVRRNDYEALNKRTVNPIPFIYITNSNKKRSASVSIASELMYDMVTKKRHLIDVAPTILEIFGLPIPDKFSGRSLIS